jgi:hypothetical protein
MPGIVNGCVDMMYMTALIVAMLIENDEWRLEAALKFEREDLGERISS